MTASRALGGWSALTIYRGENSLPIQGICARYRSRPARARREQNNRSVAQPEEYFCGKARAIGTFSGEHWAVRCCATALRFPYRHFCLGRKLDVMQPVSYSPCSLAFTFILYHSSHARRAGCCSTFDSPTCVSKLVTRCFWITTSRGSARPQYLRRTQWMPELARLSSLRASFLRHKASITSLLRLSAAGTYVASNSMSFIAETKQRRRSFPIPS